MQNIIEDLHRNKEVFFMLFKDITETEYRWKANDDTWSLLELLAHLYDEEREDFRARVKHVVEHPGTLPPSINPAEWVKSRNYIGYNYAATLQKLLQEREESVLWLRTVPEELFDHSYMHPEVGKITAKLFLVNWLAHDRMHLRQFQNIRLNYLSNSCDDNLNYAGGI